MIGDQQNTGGSDVFRASSRFVGIGFRWKDREDRYHNPEEMDTKHVFYTWLMIWNHEAPDDSMRIWFTHRYQFSSFYTPKYMLKAFGVMYFQLKNRTDVGPKMKWVIARIEAMCRNLSEFEDVRYDDSILEN